MENSEKEWGEMKVRKPVHSIELKKLAVEDYRSGRKSARQILEEYNIKRETLRGWETQVAYYIKGMMTKRRYSKAIKMKAAREIEMGFLTVRQAMTKYEIRSKQTIRGWVKLYRSDTTSILETPSAEPLAKEEEIEQNYLSIKSSESKKELEKAQLKIVALETMIDLASMEYGIDIRKKSGTKQ